MTNERASSAALSPTALSRLDAFSAVDTQSVAPMLRDCTIYDWRRNEVLIEPEQRHHGLHVLLSGRLRVCLEAPQSPAIAIIEPGETIGEVSLFDGRAASAYVVAESDSRTLVIDEDLVWLLVNSSHALASNLLHFLSRRLRGGNQVIRQERERLETYRFHATVDALTGLFNRHWLNQMLPRQMRRSSYNDEPLSVALIDVDNFKGYNDAHGHVAGDRALCAVAYQLRDNLRPADMAARYGGEEFLVLLPAAPLEGAKVVAERLVEKVAHTPVGASGDCGLPPVTVSVGIAVQRPGMSPEDFIAAGDAALYRAKRSGRNRASD